VRGPDAITLQEVTQIRRQSPGDAIAGGTTPATEVVADYLETLLSALELHGAHYAVAAVSYDLDVEVPLATGPGTFDDLRLTDRDVILVRTDLPPGYLSATNPQQGNYAAALPLPIGITVLRGWCSIDLQVRGRAFRVINTHLEEALPPSLPDIQSYQAYELLTGPANTALPVILAGDFNSDAYGNYGPSVYPLLTTAGGFSDAWSVARPGEPGLTWGHDENLANPSVVPTLRLDYVLYRGGLFQPSDAETIGWMIRGIPPLWFSDHAAVLAQFDVH
jgi:endonuclease/exonuclease/phosphatase family metal-dependent hydrolase